MEYPTTPRGTAHSISEETASSIGRTIPAFKRSGTYPLSVGSAGSERGTFDDESQTVFSPASPATQTTVLTDEHGHRRSFLRTQTDPVLHEKQHYYDDLTINPFPQVLAVAGLEDCSEQVQKALWTTMSTGKIPVGEEVDMPSVMRVLPDDFFVVYVCPYGSPHGRPPIHRSLVSATYRVHNIL